jgi:hypothetical protein
MAAPMARSPFFRLAAALLAVCALPLAAAEPHLVVIVNPDSGVVRVTRAEVLNLFLGRQKRLAPGLTAVPVEERAWAVRSRFYRILVHKDLAEIDAYWARLFFTGQAHPPKGEPSAEGVIRAVAADRSAIGLVEWGRLDSRVRVVLDVDAPEAP